MTLEENLRDFAAYYHDAPLAPYKSTLADACLRAANRIRDLEQATDLIVEWRKEAEAYGGPLQSVWTDMTLPSTLRRCANQLEAVLREEEEK